MAIIEGTPSRNNRNTKAKGLESLGEALAQAAEALPTPPVEAKSQSEKEEVVKPILQSLGELERRIYINDVDVTDAVIIQQGEDSMREATKEETRKECLRLLTETYDEIAKTKEKLRQTDDIDAIHIYATQLKKFDGIIKDLYGAGVVTPNEYNAHYKESCKESRFGSFTKKESDVKITGRSISRFVDNFSNTTFKISGLFN